MAIGALIATPFQKANIFSRARTAYLDSNILTLKSQISVTSHLVRRTVFTVLLPIMAIIYAFLSKGPPISVAAPAVFAAAVGFLSCLAISECNGMVMETFDTSDIAVAEQETPRMSAAPSKTQTSPPSLKSHRSSATGTDSNFVSTMPNRRRRNNSTFPRITAAFAVIHTLAYIFAAAATAVGGLAGRKLGQRAATGVVAGILLFLTGLLTVALFRFRTVQIVPRSRSVEMDRWATARRESIRRASTVAGLHGSVSTATGAGAREPAAASTASLASRTTKKERLAAIERAIRETEASRPLMLGNPVSRTRRCNLLELGSLSRWTEIRRVNDAYDEMVDVCLDRNPFRESRVHSQG